jgi:hypothetical protein
LAGEPESENALAEVILTPPGPGQFTVRGQQPENGTGPAACVGMADYVCDPPWIVYGEALYLRPGNDKVAYAVPIDGAIVPPVGAPPVQVGLESVVDQSFTPGFRLGIERALSPYSGLGAEFAWLDGSSSGNAAGTAALPLRSLVNHPGTVAAPTDFLAAAATSQLDFQVGDVFYRRFLMYDDLCSVSCIGGARFAHLEETFHSTFTNAAVAETVDTGITFDGGGIRLGIEAEQRSHRRNWLVYGKGFTSFVGGQFRGRYAQADSVRGLVVNTGWSEDRVVSILETELGVGWVNACGNLRISAGYLFAGWFNVINTDDFIRAVRTNDSVNVRDSLSFDGLVVRAEIHF